ncbi:MAG: hypothetical protein L3J25_09760 [Flavobacteriaceae bacterium]|nr:hypothetical protein [Flavobacteriaceae bacterium]
MQLNYNQKSKMHLIGALGLILSLVSCGSYQYVGYDDGIYGTPERNVEYPTESSNEEVTSQSSSYFQNYFKEKSQELEYLTQGDTIFTDIDSYEGNYKVANDTLVETQESYAGWGQNTSEISINIYNSGFYNNFWWNDPWRWNAGWGWNNPWFWNYGYGNVWGYGFNNFWHSPYYGYNGYYGNYYNRRGRGIAYNAGRRGAIYQNSYASRLNRRALTSTRNTTYRPRRSLNSNVRANTNTVTRPRTTTRRTINNTTRPRSTTRTRSNSPTRSTTRTRNYTPNRSTTRTRSYTPSRSSRSSTRSSSPSRSSSRSSGSTSRRKGN